MLETLLEPISDASPCGSDYKYEDDYLALEAEIDKSNSMTEGVFTDWSKVLDDTKDILSNASKDTKVMCWLIYASWKTSGVSGLQTSLSILNSLFNTYQDKLFPKSKKVKISALVWLEELLQEELLDERSSLVVSLNSEALLEIISSLQDFFALYVTEDVSIFTKLSSALQRAIKEEQTQEASQSNATSLSGQQATGIEFNEINTDDDAAKVLRSFKKNAALLHNYWREKESSDLRSIRLVRILSWLDIDSLPANESGKTPLHPPSELSLNEIEEHIENEEFAEAFSKIENLIALSPFWLEGHFLAASVMEKMGNEESAKEIKNSLVAFVKADTTILELTFNDTTPFASIDMKKWLASSLEDVVNTATDTQEDDLKGAIVEEAYKKAKKKQIKEAMGLLQNAYVSAVNNEEKFYWRLTKAELAIAFNKNDVALALLEDLKRDIDKHNLDEWKPELAAKVFTLYLNTFNRTTVDVEHLNTAYARLCKIDIAQALEIKI
ncbi:type VI secretion system protein TssA [Sulfurimonas sp.]